MQSPTSTICVLCAASEATTREHIPAELFFARPLPRNLVTVPSCAACNHNSQHEDEYLRAFMMQLRGHTPSQAIENVRSRAVRQMDREPRLRAGFQEASEFRWEVGTDGQPVVGLSTKPDRERLWKVLTKYARGLHFWSTGTILPIDAPPSIERIFNRNTRPADYWEPLLAAADYARTGTVITIGADAEFTYSFRAIDRGDALSTMVLDYYQSFAYVAIMMKPGTDFQKPQRLPF